MITGADLKAARGRMKLSRAALGRQLGVSEKTVYNWERSSVPDRDEARVRDQLGGHLGEAAPADSLRGVSDIALIAELARRLGAQKGGSSDSGQDEAEKSPDSGGDSGASVTQLRPWEEPRPADTFDPHDQRRVASRPSQEEREARRQAEAESAHIDDENQDPGGGE